MNNPQADHLIDMGRPLSEVIPLFPDKVVACQYFAQSMAQRHAGPATANCVVCGAACQTPPVSFRWRANLHTTRTVLLSFLFSALALLASHLYSRWIVVEFVTVHRMCPACLRQQRLRGMMLHALRMVLFAALIALLFLTVPLAVFLVAMPFIEPKITVILVWLCLTVISAGLLAGVVCGFEACRRWLIPAPLRPVGRYPFFLHAIDRRSQTGRTILSSEKASLAGV